MATTIFDEIRAEGEARGEVRGRVRAGQDIVLTALRKKFTKIPKHIEESIRGMSDSIVLESLISDVIESRTLDEFENVLM
ncbi:MAG: DUF4351 domain-containing protein [Planctomycetaceae bacterium]|jgi:hypothetical protein|nr:DUF4351 domain-containing protein [Planctomycetaceae bacterium]